MHRLKIPGRSGCRLDIINHGGVTLVRKYASHTDYNARLQEQHNKQKKFLELTGSGSIFSAPGIYGIDPGDKDLLTSFDMEYIQGEKYSDFFERITVHQLKTVLGEFLKFLDLEISRSRFEVPDHKLIKDKLDDLEQVIREKELNSTFPVIINTLRENIPEGPLPVGFCHGDLTFSNMIFSNGKIYLVDFLDSFLETPLMDIVKIRQDTKYLWSLFIEEDTEPHQAAKIAQVMKFLDDHLVDHFSRTPYYNDWFDFMDKLSLLRILPYLTSQDEIEFIHRCLETHD